MNIITHDKAYSIFPRATFIERRSLLYNRKQSSPDGLAKYKWHGWIQLPYLEAADYDNRSSSFARGPRRLGDSKCWTITLRPTVNSQNDYMDSNTWNLHYFARGTPSNWRVFPTYNWTLLKHKQSTYLVDGVRGNATSSFLKAFEAGKLYGIE
jgi:hypothetical protein